MAPRPRRPRQKATERGIQPELPLQEPPSPEGGGGPGIPEPGAPGSQPGLSTPEGPNEVGPGEAGPSPAAQPAETTVGSPGRIPSPSLAREVSKPDAAHRPLEGIETRPPKSTGRDTPELSEGDLRSLHHRLLAAARLVRELAARAGVSPGIPNERAPGAEGQRGSRSGPGETSFAPEGSETPVSGSGAPLVFDPPTEPPGATG